MLRGPAPNGHPCPCGALAASLPLNPLHIACVRPAPKSRFVSSDLSRMEIKSESKIKSLRIARFSQSGLSAAAIFRTPPPASRTAKGVCGRRRTDDRGKIQNMRSLLILIFGRELSSAAERDLGAGRTQVALRGSSGMDAARAAPRHGWRMAAGPRSVAGVREARRRRAQARSKHPWLLGGGAAFRLFQVTRRRRNASAVRQNPP